MGRTPVKTYYDSPASSTPKMVDWQPGLTSLGMEPLMLESPAEMEAMMLASPIFRRLSGTPKGADTILEFPGDAASSADNDESAASIDVKQLEHDYRMSNMKERK